MWVMSLPVMVEAHLGSAALMFTHLYNYPEKSLVRFNFVQIQYLSAGA